MTEETIDWMVRAQDRQAALLACGIARCRVKGCHLHMAEKRQRAPFMLTVAGREALACIVWMEVRSMPRAELHAQLVGLHAQLIADGYSFAVPNAGDREACRTARCPACGHVGLRCYGYRRAVGEHQGPSYRAVARCPGCGWAEHFC